MTDRIIVDISAEGTVRISGFPLAEEEHWSMLSRGLAGYFRAHGLIGPEKAQERLDAFYQLLDQYGIDRTGVESGIVQ